jgi:hypothetical protein
MFDNIGGKIKGFAKFNIVLGGIVAIVGTISAVTIPYGAGGWLFVVGIACLISSIFGSWFIYGFGELIESTQETNRLLRSGLAEGITKELEKRREHEAALAKEARELREQNQRAEQAKKARIATYWQEHEQERQQLMDKKSKAETALAAGGISAPQEQELQELISAIDFELTRER